VALVERAPHSPGGRRSEHRFRHATRPREEPTPGWRCCARRSCGHVLDDEHRVVVDVAFANLNHSKRPTAKRDRVPGVATTGRWSGTSAACNGGRGGSRGSAGRSCLCTRRVGAAREPGQADELASARGRSPPSSISSSEGRPPCSRLGRGRMTLLREVPQPFE
jgi:hypothetical protein